MRNTLYISMYLGAVVIANLAVARFGPSSVLFVSFFLIGLDLTSRDKLHEAWHNDGLIWKMSLLIGVGSLLSWLLNQSAGRIALASFIAFICAATVDTVIYQILHRKRYLVKVNGSNIFSALTDSLIFPTIAFGGFLPLITLGQFAAKVGGGAIWAFILGKKK